MTAPILEVSGLTSGYGDLTVVRDVSLSVEPSSITAVLGRNGAGKSTMLKAISGLLPLSAGTILYKGEPITRVPAHRRRGLGCSFVQENKRVFKRRSVEENLLMGLYGMGVKRRDEPARLEEAYTRFPILLEKRKQQAGFLSGGQQQMLAIAVALLNKPSLLMLDEPSSGLAPSIVAEVMQTVRDLRDVEGLAVLLIEQAVDTTLSIADEVVVLDVGRIVHAGPSNEPGLREIVQSAYMAAPVAR